MLSFNKNYFGFFILILVTEIFIALYVNDAFVRPYLGDVLAALLIYCFIKIFLRLPVWPVAIFSLLFSYFIEFLQYLNIVERFELHSKILRIVLGTSFSWLDMVCYTAGIVVVLIVERFHQASSKYN